MTSRKILAKKSRQCKKSGGTFTCAPAVFTAQYPNGWVQIFKLSIFFLRNGTEKVRNRTGFRICACEWEAESDWICKLSIRIWQLLTFLGALISCYHWFWIKFIDIWLDIKLACLSFEPVLHFLAIDRGLFIDTFSSRNSINLGPNSGGFKCVSTPLRRLINSCQ